MLQYGAGSMEARSTNMVKDPISAINLLATFRVPKSSGTINEACD